MSMFDDPDGLENPAIPATETRGGRAVDWDAVQPGKPLPELSVPEDEEHDLGGEG